MHIHTCMKTQNLYVILTKKINGKEYWSCIGFHTFTLTKSSFLWNVRKSHVYESHINHSQAKSLEEQNNTIMYLLFCSLSMSYKFFFFFKKDPNIYLLKETLHEYSWIMIHIANPNLFPSNPYASENDKGFKRKIIIISCKFMVMALNDPPEYGPHFGYF